MSSKTIRTVTAAAAAIGLIALAGSTMDSQDASGMPEGSEETFVVFPTYAAMGEDGSLTVPLRAWVFEPEYNSIRREIFEEALEEVVDVEDGTKAHAIYERRIQPFLVDNERGKVVTAHLGEASWKLGESAPHGHITRTLEIPSDVAMEAIRAESGERWLEFRFTSEFGVEREVHVPVIAREGVSVVSDIDDTIKITEVLDREAMLRRTFAEEFEKVDRMPELFDRLQARHDPVFHYLSASPWQLFGELEPWMERAGYPQGPLHLRRVRPANPASVHEFIQESRPHKISTLERLLAHHPERSFILIGDSGEHDPEVYAEMARRHPKRIERIYIREVSGAKNDEKRFQKAFDGVSSDKWQVFSNPDDVLTSSDSKGEKQ